MALDLKIKRKVHKPKCSIFSGFYLLLSFRICLIFEKKTVPGINMNATIRIVNTKVQLSPIYVMYNKR